MINIIIVLNTEAIISLIINFNVIGDWRIKISAIKKPISIEHRDIIKVFMIFPPFELTILFFICNLSLKPVYVNHTFKLTHFLLFL